VAPKKNTGRRKRIGERKQGSADRRASTGFLNSTCLSHTRLVLGCSHLHLADSGLSEDNDISDRERTEPGMIREALVNSPLNHARYLHGAGKGYVTIACKTSGSWEQHSYTTQELDQVLPASGGVDDVYISQNRFWGARAVSRLAQLSALYVDVDYYKHPDLNGMHPLGVLQLAFAELQHSKIPRPSLAVSTGRGLALIWRHEPVPHYVLPKWKLCQEYIFEGLKGLGADPSAKDAARVLRLVGSRNSKSGTIVEAVWEEHGEAIWNFGDLADEMLPLSRRELEERCAKRSENQDKLASSKHSTRASKSRDNIEERFTAATLALGRLGDLQHLLGLRGYDKLPPGQRDSWMFVAATSLADLVQPQFLEREILVLGRDYAGWSEAEIRSRMQAVISRAHAASAGDKVEWNGQQRDPRYWLKNKTIIDMLGITPSEEKEMQVLISKDTKRQRDRERKASERRARGAKPREEYLAEAKEKRSIALGLHQQGMSLREIGKILGVSHTQVKRMISTPQGPQGW
jgi:hypothetical protein